jgi:ubiquinone/menaquinone biosynthesis C-methylase UbiE
MAIAFRVPEMEGAMARWYAKQRRTPAQLATCRTQAAQLTGELPDSSDVLEVAPGPGYLTVEMARLGHHVTGVDISHTFIGIERETARQAGVTVDFRHGDVADLPLPAGSFDLLVCQAAFKNFTRPDRALAEMHRVLRPGATAVIDDLRRDSSLADIDREVAGMDINRFNGFVTKWTLATMLRRRAYSAAEFGELVAASPFRTARISDDGIGMRIRLTKQ